MNLPSENRADPRREKQGQARPALLFALLILTLALVGLLRPTQTTQAQEPSPTFALEAVTLPTTPPVARLAAGSYTQNCAPCHGPDGQGDGPAAAGLPGPPTKFADPAASWERSPAEWFHTTKFGRLEKLMPPWRNQLSDDQIWQVVAYSWSLHSDPAAVARGQGLYEMSCASCHGPTGAGDGPDAEGELSDFTNVSYAVTMSPAAWMGGWEQAHPEIGSEWSPENQRDVLEYLRTFSMTPAWESGYRPGDGVVRGVVASGTADVPLTEMLTVTLDAYVEFTPVASFTTTMDAGGAFTFTQLATDPSLVFLASVAVDGIRYSSPLIRFDGSSSELDTDIQVYATTDDPTTIRIDRAHWIIDQQPGALIVGQILFFGSAGDRTFIGAPVEGVDVPVTVGLFVPPGAVEVSFENGAIGGRFRQVGHFYYDTTPLTPGPGTKQIVVRYAVPYEGTTYALTQQFLHPVSEINLLVGEMPGLQVEVDAMTSIGPQAIQDSTFLIWEGADLPAGDVTVEFQGLLAASAADPSGGATATGAGVGGFAPWMAWATGGVVGMVLAAGVMWAWRNGQVQAGTQAEDINAQLDELTARIAALDDQHDLGQIETALWQRQRAALKAQLLDLSARAADKR